MTEKQLPIAEKEVDLLKAVFKDNDGLLLTMRSLFFGFPLTVSEKKTIKETFKGKEIREAIRKKIYPVLSNNVPIGQVADFWMGMEQQIFGQMKDTIYQAVASKEKVFDMLEEAMTLLENPDGKSVDIQYLRGSWHTDPGQINLLARTLYIKTIETGLMMIKVVASQGESESMQQVKERIMKDSTK